MDTFWDSPYDPEDFTHEYAYDDNHMALQSCGPGQQNSVAHLGTPNCLITLGGTSTLVSNPNTSAAPPVAASAVTLSDGAPHQVVVVYNGDNDSPKDYISVYLDAALNAGTHTPVAGSVPVFSGPFDIANYVNLNKGTAYVGFTAATGGSFQQNELMGFSFTPHDFASANVCPSGQTTPAPCNSPLPVGFNFSGATTVSQIQVVTQGVTGLDFQLGTGSTCVNSFSAGDSCTVNVNFAPLAPGLRMGAVNLLDSLGNVLATRMIYGTGQGPAVAFGPGAQTTVNTGGNSLAVPNGVAVDAAGDVFIADGGAGYVGGGAQVLKVAPGGSASSLGFNLAYPQGLAVDGAGNVYIADNNLNEVLKVPAGCNNFGCQQVVATPQCVVGVSGFCAQLGVAVDGIGDLFIASYNSEVLEVPANGGAQTVVYNPSGSHPIGLATDAAGDLFIADYGLHKVVEIPAGGGAQTTVGTGWVEPEAVAVDAAGDVFVADESSLDESPRVVEVPADCTNNLNNCQITISNTLVYGVAVDAKGDVFLPERNGTQVDEINKSQTPALNFPTATNVGSSDIADGASSVTLENVGNATLSLPIPVSGNDPSIGADFSLFSSGQGDCPLTTASSSSPGTLAAGASCVYSVTFAPIAVGNPHNESLVLTDNNLNAVSPSPAATQTIGLSGVGVSSTYTVGGSVTGLIGSGLVLQDNGGDDLPISGDGAFTFATALSNGSPYSVTVLSSPIAQNCAVTNGGGTVGNANISDVLVSCTTIPSYGLSVTEIGSGSGMVTSSAGAISCIDTNGSVTGQCSDSYLSGTPVTLTASASGTSTFLGWGGACAASGTSPTCNVSVSSVLNATASFVQQKFGDVNVCPRDKTLRCRAAVRSR